jgi:hypothetical protein
VALYVAVRQPFQKVFPMVKMTAMAAYTLRVQDVTFFLSTMTNAERFLCGDIIGGMQLLEAMDAANDTEYTVATTKLDQVIARMQRRLNRRRW